MKISDKMFATLCCIYAGLAFGIYWLPIRRLRQVGFNDIWAVFIFSFIPLILIIPIIIYRRHRLFPGRLRFHICTILSGVGFAFYVGSFLYTNVIHAIVLYYLLPIWGFILARILIGEPITMVRLSAMTLAILGMVILISPETGIPIPTLLGDWMALLGGFIWAAVALMLYTDRSDPINYAIGFIVWSALASCAIAVASSFTGIVSYPNWLNIKAEIFWLLPFSIFVIVPAAFATMYGPSKLNPGVAGLLFMTELSVGAVTAALLSGEAFGLREISGIVFITAAGILEPLEILWKMDKKRQMV